MAVVKHERLWLPAGYASNDLLVVTNPGVPGVDALAPRSIAEVLALLGDTRGMTFRRGASGWEAQALGSSGQVLGSDGTDAAWRNQFWRPVQTITSGGATVSFTHPLVVGRDYMLVIRHLRPASDSDLYLRVSDDDGSTFEADASDYAWCLGGYRTAAFGGADQADSEINLAGFVVEATSGYFSGVIWFGQQSGKHWSAKWLLGGLASLGTDAVTFGHGRHLSTSDVDRIRLLMSSGNISEIDATLYEGSPS